MASPFDYVKSINSGKRIDVGTDYNQFYINEVFSHYPECVFIVSNINRQNISDQMHYDYMMSAIRPRKRKYIALNKKKRTDNDIFLISNFYKYSMEKAKEALSVMSDDQLMAFKKELGIEA